MDRVRKNETLLVAAGLVLLAVVLAIWAVPAALSAVSEVDAKYLPLIGSCITASATLIAVLLTGLGVVVAYRNLANPFRLELHKKQTEVICELMELAWENYNLLCVWEADRSQDTAAESWKAHVAAFAKLWKKQNERGVLLSNSVNQSLIEFMDGCRLFSGSVMADVARTTNIQPESAQFRASIFKFMDICREALHTDRLTESTKRHLSTPKPQAR